VEIVKGIKRAKTLLICKNKTKDRTSISTENVAIIFRSGPTIWDKRWRT